MVRIVVSIHNERVMNVQQKFVKKLSVIFLMF